MPHLDDLSLVDRTREVLAAPPDVVVATTGTGFRGWIGRQRFVIAFVVLAALALLTHYNAVFVVVAWYLWWGAWVLLRHDRWRRLGTVCAAGGAMTLLVLPVLYLTVERYFSVYRAGRRQAEAALAISRSA